MWRRTACGDRGREATFPTARAFALGAHVVPGGGHRTHSPIRPQRGAGSQLEELPIVIPGPVDESPGRGRASAGRSNSPGLSRGSDPDCHPVRTAGPRGPWIGPKWPRSPAEARIGELDVRFDHKPAVHPHLPVPDLDPARDRDAALT